MQMIALLSKDTGGKLSGKTFAISSQTILSLQKLAALFEKVTGKKLHINWGGRTYRLREVMTPWNKGEKIPGWKPTTTLEEGIRKVIQ
jgi:nucleoside-diphosphate-sugar epimerase